MRSCMGGFCLSRDNCANFHAATPLQLPAQRLCPRDQEDPTPIRHVAVYTLRPSRRVVVPLRQAAAA